MIIDELLPRLYAEYRITRDPERHAIAGWSSGAIAAFTVAWERPDEFRKVLSGIGTYVNLAGGHVYPDKVMASERKPIRIFMIDGRKPAQKVLDDPTFAGYSTGHWEGDTLVVDTVAIREEALFDTFSPHSDQFSVRERIRFASPGVLEDRITVTDPKALLEPFTSVRTYRKMSAPNDELREFSCAEGLASTK